MSEDWLGLNKGFNREYVIHPRVIGSDWIGERLVCTAYDWLVNTFVTAVYDHGCWKGTPWCSKGNDFSSTVAEAIETHKRWVQLELRNAEEEKEYFGESTAREASSAEEFGETMSPQVALELCPIGRGLESTSDRMPGAG